MSDWTKSKIYVAGHRGLVGSAIVRALRKKDYSNIVTRTREEMDLNDTDAVKRFFETEKPEVVIIAAAKVGGIGANQKSPVEFLLQNLKIQNNLISSSADCNVKKLMFLSSSCAYPAQSKLPIDESQLLTGAFETTNEAYALAKATGMKLCEAYAKEYGKNFMSLIPCNVYGPNDTYHLEGSHVIPSMILKFLKAKKDGANEVVLWGSGRPLREFIHSDDLAEAILVCLEKHEATGSINIGPENEISISNLAKMIRIVSGYEGDIRWDQSRPDGVYRKVMNSSKIRNLGWKPNIHLEAGLKSVMEEARKRLDL